MSKGSAPSEPEGEKPEDRQHTVSNQTKEEVEITHLTDGTKVTVGKTTGAVHLHEPHGRIIKFHRPGSV